MPCSDGDVKCNDGIHCFPESSYCDKYQACTDGTDDDPDMCKGIVYVNNIISHSIWCTVKFRGRDRLVVNITCAISAYHH